MGPFITTAGRKWPAHSADINEMLGLGRKGKVPIEGLPARQIQGVNVWAISLAGARSLGQRFSLRVMCECPVCGRKMAVGRLAQHAKVH